MSEAMTEFRITSDLSALRGQVIEANFDEVHEWLETNLAPYRELAVTPETVPAAKNYRAAIRKVRDRIDASRKEAKNAALMAYSSFEVKCKELTGLCDEAADAIDSQVKALENAEKQEKISRLRMVYAKCVPPDIWTYLPWERVYRSAWENKGYKEDDAAKEIAEAAERTKKDLDAIRAIKDESVAYLLDVYRETLDLGTVLRKQAEIRAVREAEEKRKKADAADGGTMRASCPTEETQGDEVGAEDDAVDDGPKVTVRFQVCCTRAKLAALAQFLRENGIDYGRA